MRLVALGALLALAGCPSKAESRKRRTEAAIEKMLELASNMCACKDKACVDHVQDAMMVWSMEMAKGAEPLENHNTDEAQMKRMTTVAAMYTECLTKAMAMNAPPIDPLPPEPVRPSLPPETTSGDVDALIRSARTWASDAHPQLALAAVTIAYVDASGVLDEEHGRLTIGFDHPPSIIDDAKRKTGAPVAPSTEINSDCIGLTWERARGWQSVETGCNHVLKSGIRCSVPEIWKRSIAMGDPADALATIEVRPTRRREWHFRIEDVPRNVHIAHVFPDDCPLAVEK